MDDAEEEDEDQLELELGGCMKRVAEIQECFSNFAKENKSAIKTVFFAVLLLLYLAYFIAALVKVRAFVAWNVVISRVLPALDVTHSSACFSPHLYPLPSFLASTAFIS